MLRSGYRRVRKRRSELLVRLQSSISQKRLAGRRIACAQAASTDSIGEEREIHGKARKACFTERSLNHNKKIIRGE
jgi:hypothetical protein